MRFRISNLCASIYVVKMPEPSAFGRRLKAVREARGWTQDELSGRASLPSSVISHFETGVRGKPSADNLVKLANALSVSVDFLLGRTELPEVSDERVVALLRSLSTAPAEQYEGFVDWAQWFVRRGKEKTDEPPTSDDPEGGDEPPR